MQETTSASVPTTPFKRSATAPEVFRQHLASQSATLPAGAQLEEQLLESSESELHMTGLAAPLITSTPKHESFETSPDHELYGALSMSQPEATPTARFQPNTSTSYLHSSTEPISMILPQQSREASSGFNLPESTPANPSAVQHDSSYDRVHGASNHSSREALEPHACTYRRQSRSTNISRENSVRSLCSSTSRKKTSETVVRMAHMAIDLMAHISQDQLSEWYKSDSTSSMSSCQRHLQSETSSVYSESDNGHSNPWEKKHSQSFHGRHSSHSIPSEVRLTPSAPSRNVYETPTRPVVATEDILHVHVDSQSDSESALSYEESPGVVRRRKASQQVPSNFENHQRESVMSDATLKQFSTTSARQSTASDITLKRQSVLSDGALKAYPAAASEASPRSSQCTHSFKGEPLCHAV